MTRVGWMACGAAAVAGAPGLVAAMQRLGIRPTEEPPFVVVSSAATHAVRTRAFAPVASGTTHDVHALASLGAHLYAAGAAGTLLRLEDPRRGFASIRSGTERDLFAL